MTLHPDFGAVTATPGASHITARHELFDLVNLITFGGDADRPTHVPAQLADLGPFVLWESTGAADQLPFWNTNHDGDAWLYIVHGSVRVEFKETEGDTSYGHYAARTGDLFKLSRTARSPATACAASRWRSCRATRSGPRSARHRSSRPTTPTSAASPSNRTATR